MKKIISMRTLKMGRPLKEGEAIPPFYLPVYDNFRDYTLECWIFPLAPIVLFWRIGINICWTIWKDLLMFQRLQRYKD